MKKDDIFKLGAHAAALYCFLSWKIKQHGGSYQRSFLELQNDLSMGNRALKTAQQTLIENGLIIATTDYVSENNKVKKTRTLYTLPNMSNAHYANMSNAHAGNSNMSNAHYGNVQTTPVNNNTYKYYYGGGNTPTSDNNTVGDVTVDNNTDSINDCSWLPDAED